MKLYYDYYVLAFKNLDEMVKLPEKYKMLKVMQKLKNFNRSISAKVFDDMVNDLSLKKKKPKGVDGFLGEW